MAKRKMSPMLKKALDKKLTDESVFKSNAFLKIVTNIVSGVGRVYGRPMKVQVQWGNPSGTVACTDNKMVYLNANNSLVQDETRENRAIMLIGIVLHECLHILYTPFFAFKTLMEKMQKEKITGEDTPTVDEMLSRSTTKVCKLFRTFNNCVEDGYIEKRGMKVFRGYAPNLKAVRDKQLVSSPFYSDEKASGVSVPVLLINMTLLYAKYGVTPDEEDDITEAFAGIQPLIDECLAENDGKRRLLYSLYAFDGILNLIISKEEEEKSKSKSESGETDEGDSSESGESSDSGESGEDSGSSESESSEDTKESGEAEDSEEKESGSDGSGTSDKSSSDKSTDDGSSGEESGKTESTCSPAGASLTDDELESILSDMEKESAPMDDPSEHSADKDDLVDDADEEDKKELPVESTEKLEEEAKDELGDISDGLSKEETGSFAGDVHSGYSLNVVTPHNDILGEQLLATEHGDTIKKMVRLFKKEIKLMVQGSAENGQYYGEEIDDILRVDLRRCSKRIAPMNVPDLAIMLLVDLSGSMSGENVEYAKICAYMMLSFCNQLRIPCAVYGFYEPYDTPFYNKVVKYSDFDDFSKKGLEKIASMRAYENNRDGLALRYVSELMVPRPEGKKIVFTISDGQPAANCYSMYNGKPDIQDCLKVYSKYGIRYITAGISGCAPSIKEIYTEGLSPKVQAKFLDISNPQDLPKTFINILKKEVLPRV